MSGDPGPVFARIASRYDLINRILSLGRERRWRRRGVEMLPLGRVLDLGCGTGDTDFGSRSVVGIDPVIEMLARSPVSGRVVAVGEALPFRDRSFQGVFSGYVMRNLTSVSDTLDEVQRVLEPGGVFVVIDLGRPSNPVLRAVHRLGTAVILPLVGLLFAGSPAEYWYLHRSLDSLPPPEVLYRDRRLQLEEVWRMGLFGFVHGARLRKS